MREIIGIDSDDDDCQVISEIQSSNETNNTQLPNTTATISSQNVPVLTTNAGVWNSLLPNVNFSMLGMNQMLASNLIDPSLFVGQTVLIFSSILLLKIYEIQFVIPFQFNVFGNVLPQLPNSTAPVTPEPNANTVIKTIIHCKSCTLFPPNPNAPAPTTRDRPLGCKTVFVGGLPENVKGS